MKVNTAHASEWRQSLSNGVDSIQNNQLPPVLSLSWVRSAGRPEQEDSAL